MDMHLRISSWSSMRHLGDWEAYFSSRAHRGDASRTQYTSWMSRGSRSRLASTRIRPYRRPLRCWSACGCGQGFVTPGNGRVFLRSDSQAALGATFKLRSWDPRVGAVVREILLDLAEGNTRSVSSSTFLVRTTFTRTDIRGSTGEAHRERYWRSWQAGERDVTPKRSQEWWETAEMSEERRDSEGTAEQSGEEVGQRWRGVFAGTPWEAVRSRTRRPPAQPPRQTCRSGRELLLHLVGCHGWPVEGRSGWAGVATAAVSLRAQGKAGSPRRTD